MSAFPVRAGPASSPASSAPSALPSGSAAARPLPSAATSFTTSTTEAGVTCLDGSGRGFTISREDYTLH